MRNVQKSQHESFAESHHLEGDIDMYKVISMLLTEQERRTKIGVKDKGDFFSILFTLHYDMTSLANCFKIGLFFENKKIQVPMYYFHFIWFHWFHDFF